MGARQAKILEIIQNDLGELSLPDRKAIVEIPFVEANTTYDQMAIKYHKKRYIQPFDLESLGIRQEELSCYFRLTPQAEDLLFQNYFKYRNSRVYHYTSLAGLHAILTSQQLRLTALPGLNDREETSKETGSIIKHLKNPYHLNHIEALNNRYVFSCSELEDDLNQWRLYGDDGMGACVELTLENEVPRGFFIGNVRYDNNFFESLTSVMRKIFKATGGILVFNRLSVWLYFLKSSMWKNEREVRILYWDQNNLAPQWEINRYGILSKYISFARSEFPGSITKIILGPKFPEKNTNRSQLKLFINQQWRDKKLQNKIVESSILNYR